MVVSPGTKMDVIFIHKILGILKYPDIYICIKHKVPCEYVK